MTTASVEAGEPPVREAAGGDGAVPSSGGSSAGGAAGRWPWWLLVAALAVFAYAWVSWQQADGDPERARAVLRDDALIQGIAAVETMNSMDHREVDAGLDAWRSVTTGVLHDQLVAIGDDERQLLVDQGKIATGRVVEAAITELSDRTATMVAAMEVSVADGEGEEPTVKRNRFSADLVLVDSEWKLEELNQVAVSLS